MFSYNPISLVSYIDNSNFYFYFQLCGSHILWQSGKNISNFNSLTNFSDVWIDALLSATQFCSEFINHYPSTALLLKCWNSKSSAVVCFRCGCTNIKLLCTHSASGTVHTRQLWRRRAMMTRPTNQLLHPASDLPAFRVSNHATTTPDTPYSHNFFDICFKNQ